MDFDRELVSGILLRRYKRFLADVTLRDGSTTTAHCANPGSMLGLAAPGSRVWLEPNDDPKRKLRYSWKLVELADGELVGIDTGLPNRLLSRVLANREVPELRDYGNIRREVGYGKSSRVDFLLTEPGLPDAYVEAKNVHLSRKGGLAEFPDSVTARGAKHLDELAGMVSLGCRGIMLYLVQRMDCTAFRLAADIDPAYARAFDKARSAGVEMLCYDTAITVGGVSLGARLPVDPAPQSRP